MGLHISFYLFLFDSLGILAFSQFANTPGSVIDLQSAHDTVTIPLYSSDETLNSLNSYFQMYQSGVETQDSVNPKGSESQNLWMIYHRALHRLDNVLTGCNVSETFLEELIPLFPHLKLDDLESLIKEMKVSDMVCYHVPSLLFNNNDLKKVCIWCNENNENNRRYFKSLIQLPDQYLSKLGARLDEKYELKYREFYKEWSVQSLQSENYVSIRFDFVEAFCKLDSNPKLSIWGFYDKKCITVSGLPWGQDQCLRFLTHDNLIMKELSTQFSWTSVFLSIYDGKRILETDYQNAQVLEEELNSVSISPKILEYVRERKDYFQQKYFMNIESSMILPY